MERTQILNWLREHPEKIHDSAELLLARCEAEVHGHAREDAWLRAKQIAEERERHWHAAWGARASQVFVAREVCRRLAADLKRREPVPEAGHEPAFVDSDVLEMLEPDARAMLLSYVLELARAEVHRIWVEVMRFTKQRGLSLARTERFSSELDFDRTAPYAETAERVMHILAEEYERHAHPRAI
jgi:hypothetical protein